MSPLGRLRQQVTLRHLEWHLDSFPRGLRALDAGGGTGSYAISLAQQGHQVCLLDFSSQMLAIALRKVEELDPLLLERMDLCLAPVEEVPSLFPPEHFDLVVCHTLLEYVPEPWEVLRDLSAVLKPGGLMSLLLTNPCTDALRWALVRLDLDQARRALFGVVSSADLFGLTRCAYPLRAVREALDQAEVDIAGEYGVRIFSDYLPTERLADPQFFARLVELEMAASALKPYGLIGRYVHLLATKPVPGGYLRNA